MPWTRRFTGGLIAFTLLIVLDCVICTPVISASKAKLSVHEIELVGEDDSVYLSCTESSRNKSVELSGKKMWYYRASMWDSWKWFSNDSKITVHGSSCQCQFLCRVQDVDFSLSKLFNDTRPLVIFRNSSIISIKITRNLNEEFGRAGVALIYSGITVCLLIFVVIFAFCVSRFRKSRETMSLRCGNVDDAPSAADLPILRLTPPESRESSNEFDVDDDGYIVPIRNPATTSYVEFESDVDSPRNDCLYDSVYCNPTTGSVESPAYENVNDLKKFTK